MVVLELALLMVLVVVAIVVRVTKLPCCVFPISLVVVLVPVLVDGRW